MSTQSPEQKLGGPFADLPPGTLAKLSFRLDEPIAGVFLISGRHWEILDKDLKTVSSFNVKISIDKVIMHEDRVNFIGIGDTGIGIYNSQTARGGYILETSNSWAGTVRPILTATSPTFDTILYPHFTESRGARQGTRVEPKENLTSYSISHNTNTVIRTFPELQRTYALFRIGRGKYIRFTCNSIAIGDEKGEEVKAELKVPIHPLKVIKINASRFFTFHDHFQVINVDSALNVSVTLLNKTFEGLNKELEVMECADAATRDLVVMTTKRPVSVYLLNLAMDFGKEAFVRTNDIPRTPSYEEGCAIAVAGGIVFVQLRNYADSLLTFEISKITRQAEGSSAVQEPRAEPTQARKEKYKIKPEDVHGKNLSYTKNTPAGRKPFPIDVLEHAKVSTPEYVLAVKTVVKLIVEIPRDLQNVIAKFLLS